MIVVLRLAEAVRGHDPQVLPPSRRLGDLRGHRAADRGQIGIPDNSDYQSCRKAVIGSTFDALRAGK